MPDASQEVERFIETVEQVLAERHGAPPPSNEDAGARFDCLRYGTLIQKSFAEAGAAISNLFPGPREHPPSEEVTAFTLRDLKAAAEGISDSVRDANTKFCFRARPTFALPELTDEAVAFEARVRELDDPPTFERYVDLQDRWSRLGRLVREVRGEPMGGFR